MEQVMVYADPGSRYLAALQAAEDAVDRLDPESILRHFILAYDRADRNGAAGTHRDGTPFLVTESLWLKSAAAMARQFVADRDQMERIRIMESRASNQDKERDS